MDAAVQKKRLIVMIAVNVACLIAGLAAIIGHVAFDVGPLLWAFIAAVAGGMAAQLWFVLGWMKAERGA